MFQPHASPMHSFDKKTNDYVVCMHENRAVTKEKQYSGAINILPLERVLRIESYIAAASKTEREKLKRKI